MEEARRYRNTVHHTVLMIEHDPAEIELAQRAALECGYEFTLMVLQNTDAVLTWMDDEMPDQILPHLIMIDLRLPKLDGLAMLRKLRIDAATCNIPILVFSAEYAQPDVLMSYQAGANSFVAKPQDLQQFTEFFREQLPYWLEPRQCKQSPSGC